MKFKVIFLSFNILIVFSFLMIFLLPVFMLGGDYAGLFWQESWYIALIFILILIVINILYFFNRNILSALENENWPELKLILEDRLFNKKKLSRMNIRMYVNTCVAVSSIPDIEKLEALIREHRPSAMPLWAVPLGLPHLLSNDARRMKDFYGEFIDSAKERGWVRWNYCFALLMQKENDEAVEILTDLASDDKEPLLMLVSLYMLAPFHSDEKIGAVVESGRSSLKKQLSPKVLEAELEKKKDNVQMLFLTKIIGEASDWLNEG